MKKDIIPQLKGVNGAGAVYLPAFCNAGPGNETVVHLQQTVVNLVTSPDISLVLCKSRIEGSNI